MACATVFVVCSAAAAASQERLVFTPFFASYFPLSKLRNVSPNEWERQTPGPALGAQLTYRAVPVFGIEASGTFAFSNLIVSDPSGVFPSDVPRNGYVVFLNGRFVFYPGRSNLKLLVGAGAVRRGGDPWDDSGYPRLTEAAAVGGFGMRAALNSSIDLDIGVEINVYTADPDGPDGDRYTERVQEDILVLIGFPFRLVL